MLFRSGASTPPAHIEDAGTAIKQSPITKHGSKATARALPSPSLAPKKTSSSSSRLSLVTKDDSKAAMKATATTSKPSVATTQSIGSPGPATPQRPRIRHLCSPPAPRPQASRQMPSDVAPSSSLSPVPSITIAGPSTSAASCTSSALTLVSRAQATMATVATDKNAKAAAEARKKADEKIE